jgi:hypothetical protein
MGKISINLRQWLLVALAAPALLATGQSPIDTIPAPKNQLSVDVQILGRGESRYGGLPAAPKVDEEESESENDNVPKSNFVLSRTRLPINFQRDWLEARVTPQHSGVWGQAGRGAFNLHEAWVKMTTRFGMFAQVGRVALNYDDERIIGSDEWAMASSSHDVLRLGYEGHGHKAHIILAYNQNANVTLTGGSIYEDGAQPYKTMHTAWYHYDVPRFPLGVSLLFMNIGMQSKLTNKPDKTWFQHLAGGYMSFQPEHWKAEAAYYKQFGKNEHGVKIDAWMASTKVTYIQSPRFNVTAGYDHLSGDKYFAVPTGHNIGMIHHDVIKGFSTVYGSHHQFYGAMDFFYVSAYHHGFTPGLQNAYIGSTYCPLKNMMINASYHYLAMATNLDDMERTLGHEIEFQAAYSISRDVSVSAGASFMWGTETMERLKRSSSKNNLRWGWITLSVNPRIFSFKW